MFPVVSSKDISHAILILLPLFAVDGQDEEEAGQVRKYYRAFLKLLVWPHSYNGMKFITILANSI